MLEGPRRPPLSLTTLRAADCAYIRHSKEIIGTSSARVPCCGNSIQILELSAWEPDKLGASVCVGFPSSRDNRVPCPSRFLRRAANRYLVVGFFSALRCVARGPAAARKEFFSCLPAFRFAQSGINPRPTTSFSSALRLGLRSRRA